MIVPLNYFLATGAALFALGLAGAVASRHFVITILSLELVFAGSIVAGIGFFSNSSSNGMFFPVLLSIWAVAALEIVGLVAFYVYMKGKVPDFDLKKLVELKG